MVITENPKKRYFDIYKLGVDWIVIEYDMSHGNVRKNEILNNYPNYIPLGGIWVRSDLTKPNDDKDLNGYQKNILGLYEIENDGSIRYNSLLDFIKHNLINTYIKKDINKEDIFNIRLYPLEEEMNYTNVVLKGLTFEILKRIGDMIREKNNINKLLIPFRSEIEISVNKKNIKFITKLPIKNVE